MNVARRFEVTYCCSDCVLSELGWFGGSGGQPRWNLKSRTKREIAFANDWGSRALPWRANRLFHCHAEAFVVGLLIGCAAISLPLLKAAIRAPENTSNSARWMTASRRIHYVCRVSFIKDDSAPFAAIFCESTELMANVFSGSFTWFPS
jgi:hypothetical protein